MGQVRDTFEMGLWPFAGTLAIQGAWPRRADGMQKSDARDAERAVVKMETAEPGNAAGTLLAARRARYVMPMGWVPDTIGMGFRYK